MNLDIEETYETDNLYIESTHGSLKNIIESNYLDYLHLDDLDLDMLSWPWVTSEGF